MITFRYKIYIIVLNLILALGLVSVTGQTVPNVYEAEEFILQEEYEGTESYEFKASNYVSFIEEFNYLQPAANQYFSAKVDPYLTIVPEVGTTGGAPNNDEGGIVGSLPGNLTVSNSGAAVYNIPIQLPPGRAGMMPELSLAYSSNGGNGLLGMGWSLSGLSAISRVGTSLYNDDYIDGVDFDENDQFALNRNRLIEVSTMEYRTEIETFSKIIRHDIPGEGYGPEWFEVWTKDGKRIEFGKTEDSRIEGQWKVQVLYWLINRIEDRKGNYIDYTYFEDNDDGEFYISEIKYTGNYNTSDDPFYKIHFIYNYDRLDYSTKYVANCALKTEARLETIEIKYNSTLINRYELEYNVGLFYSHLNKVTVYDKDNNKFNPTAFTWSGTGTDGFDDYPINEYFCLNDGFQSGNHPRMLADVNGDGMDDLIGFGHDGVSVAISTGSGWETYPGIDDFGIVQGFDEYTRPRMMADVNGDGMADVVAFGHHGVAVKVSTGTGWETYNGYDYFGSADGFDHASRPRMMADVNGDGMADIIGFGHDGVAVAISTGSGFVSYPGHNYFGNNDGFDPDDPDPWEMTNPRMMADVNGDGMADIIGFGHDGVAVAVSTGDGWEDYPGYSGFGSGDGYDHPSRPRLMADINGDGMADILGFGHHGVTVVVSTGNGWDSSYPNHTSFGNDDGYDPGNPEIITNPRRMADVNGDGLADIIGFGYDNVKVVVSTGTGWDSHPGFPYYGSGQNYYNESIFPRRMADVNGDGSSDIVGFGHDDVEIVTSDIREKRRLRMIKNGYGITNTIVYDKLSTSGTNYFKGNTATYPLMDYQGPLYFVKKISSSAGFPNETNYFYKEAIIHRRGKGFMGFMEIMTKTPLKWTFDKVSVKKYDIHSTYFFPYLTESTTYHHEDYATYHYLNQTFYQNSVKGYNDKRIFPYVAKSCSKLKDLNGTYIKTINTFKEYDDYGNVTSDYVFTDPNELEITSADSEFDFQSLTTNTYNPAIIDTDWIIGQLDNSITARVHPDASTPDVVIASYDYYELGDPQYPYLKSESAVPNGNSSLEVEVEYDYDVYGNIKKTTNRAPNATPAINPRITDYFFEDPYFRFVTKTQKIVNGILFETTADYDPVLGKLIFKTDVNGLTTSYEYNGFGKLITTTMPDNNKITSVLRWSVDNPDKPSGALFHSWTKTTGKAKNLVFYDELGTELRTVIEGYADNSMIYHDYLYNEYYELISSSEPYFKGDDALWTAYEYDWLNRVETLTSPTAIITYTYDGNEVTTLNTNTLQQSKKTVNAAGQPKFSEDECGIIEYIYHKSGNVKEISSNGVSVTMDYDAAGRQKELNDPDAGIITYIYNAFGELVSQTDAATHNYTMIYDDLGRILQKTLEGTADVSTYVYDTEENGIGLLASITGSSTNNYKYDDYSRLIEETETFEGNSYTSTYGYNCFGDISKMTYPSGFELKYIYNNRGYLKYIKAPEIDTKVWLAEEINAKGQIEQFLLGNGLRTNHEYDEYGYPDKIITDNDVQELDFDFDQYTGNLTKRKDELKGLEETFTYDETKLNNRLTGYQVGAQPYSINYHDNGNIDTKSDVGTYGYGTSTRPHAVESIIYDQTGNPGYTDNQYITYNAFNSIETIDEAEGYNLYHLDVTYGNDEQRIKTEFFNSSDLIKLKLFIGGNYEIETDLSGATRILHYIGDFAIYVMEDDGFSNMYYIHKDYLGSYYAVTDEEGNIVQQDGVEQVYSFDPWGRRRNPNDWTYTSVPEEYLFDRGYTGHEHLDVFGLINMNGRVYDPILGRMLSPDNFVQAPGFSQSFNRYSYAMNNPLVYVDPSGEVLEWVAIGIAVAYMYLHAAHENRDTETGQWAWNPGDWFDSDSDAGIVVGVSTNSDFSNFTFYGGIDPGNGNAPMIGYNTDNGIGVGNPNSPGGISFYYPTVDYNAPAENANLSIDIAHRNYYDESLRASSGGNGFEIGPIGVGFSFELAYPKFWRLDEMNFGISMGFVADTKGLSGYVNKKTAEDGGVSFSLAPEVFYVHGTQGNVYNTILNGAGYSSSAGFFFMGAEFGTDNAAIRGVMPAYYQISLTAFGRGLDFSYANWNTNTKIYPIFYPSKK